jgi:Tol biopolymer transport system component
MTPSPRRSFSCEDLTLYRSITDLRCSPGGDEAVYTVHSVDRDGDSYQTSLWLVSLERGEPRQLVSAESALSMPRWLPNGKGIAFVSSRSESPQVHVLPRDGGEAYQLTRLEGGLGSYTISADGRWLLAVSQIPSGARSLNRSPSPTNETGAQLASMAPFKSNGMGFLLDKQPHIFVVDLQGGDPKQITSGDFEVRSAGWSPDGTRIAYVRTREGRQTHRTDLWLVGRDGKNARRISQNVASAQTPLWSPDGSTVAFAGGEVEGDANIRWWRYDVEQDRVQPFGPDSIEVVEPQGAAWSADSGHLTFVNARRGRQEVATLHRDDDTLRTLVRGEDLQVRKVSATEQRVAFVSSRLTEPCELYVGEADGSNARRVTDLNGWWRERRQPVVKLMQFAVPDGDGARSTSTAGWCCRKTPATSRCRCCSTRTAGLRATSISIISATCTGRCSGRADGRSSRRTPRGRRATAPTLPDGSMGGGASSASRST